MSSLVLDSITPLIITYNEEPNVGRVLERLRWASRVLVVDSQSSDRTREIACSFDNVEVLERPFESFADQCRFGLSQIDSEWVLSLDSDYVCSERLIQELGRLEPSPRTGGFSVSFRYCVNGRPLRGTLYPDRVVLHRRHAVYTQDGHAHRVKVVGTVRTLSGTIDHDDRKPLSAWLEAQARYAELETAKLRETPASELGRVDRLRRGGVVMPFLMPLYCLFGKRLLLDGPAGWYYTLQRTYAEILLALRIWDERLRGDAD